MMTPCEKLGWKVGDKFTVKGSDWFEDGEELLLFQDDGDEEPVWMDSSEDLWYELISKMTPIVLITENE